MTSRSSGPPQPTQPPPPRRRPPGAPDGTGGPIRPPLSDILARTVVVGTSCSGKTSFGRRLSAALDCPFTELDALHWGPSWTPNPREVFHERVRLAASGERWVMDGNYADVRPLIWPRATAVVWLNYPFVSVFGRALSRTFRRVATREELYAGNRESLRNALLSKDSILLWVLQTYGKNRRRYRELSRDPEYSHLHWFEMRRPGDAEAFLREIS